MTVLIAGAGIGGLTLGLTLHQLGLPFQIVEAVDKIRPVGLGLVVQPQAVREYQALGLEAELSRLGLRTGRVRYFNEFGQEIWHEPRGLAAGYRWPQYALHRGNLQRMLYRALLQRAGPEVVKCGAALDVVRVAATREVEITVANRRLGGVCGAYHGQVLVAADGVNSRLRALLHPQEELPRWDGAMIWRGLAPAPRLFDGRTMVVIGSGQRKFICYPIAEKPGAGFVMNWIAILRQPSRAVLPDTDWQHEGRLADFLHRFSDWGFDWLDVPGLIGRSERVLEYPLVDRDPLAQWSYGPLTLMGDAAHPMHPTGSNGASHAVLDARYLGRALRDNGVNETALQVYDATRRAAANALVLANRAAGPERMLDVVAERAPWGFDDIEAVMPLGERRALIGDYKRLAGAEVDTLNARPPLLDG